MFGNGKYGFVSKELHRGLHTALVWLRTAQSLDVQITCGDTAIECYFFFVCLFFFVKGSKINVIRIRHLHSSHLPSPGP